MGRERAGCSRDMCHPDPLGHIGMSQLSASFRSRPEVVSVRAGGTGRVIAISLSKTCFSSSCKDDLCLQKSFSMCLPALASA